MTGLADATPGGCGLGIMILSDRRSLLVSDTRKPGE